MSRIRRLALGLAVAAALAGTGCTHVQLRKNTVNQADTLSEIYQQQVLDNLAMFVYDYYSLPHFAIPTGGTSQLTDMGSAQTTIGWATSGFASANVNPSLSRTNLESWSLTPLVDPRVLELMRCAYQRAVQSCYPDQAEPGGCPNCQKRFNEFYTGDPTLAVPPPGSKNDTGIVTSECLRPGCCWFHVACEKCLPKYSKCCRIGHYCGVYVCVPPGRGQDELTKLTLVILDFAFTKAAPEPPPPAPATETVVSYQTADGRPTNQANAQNVITRTRPGPQPQQSSNPAAVHVEAEPGYGTLPRREPRANPSGWPGMLELKQQLQAVGVP